MDERIKPRTRRDVVGARTSDPAHWRPTCCDGSAAPDLQTELHPAGLQDSPDHGKDACPRGSHRFCSADTDLVRFVTADTDSFCEKFYLDWKKTDFTVDQNSLCFPSEPSPRNNSSAEPQRTDRPKRNEPSCLT